MAIIQIYYSFWCIKNSKISIFVWLSLNSIGYFTFWYFFRINFLVTMITCSHYHLMCLILLGHFYHKKNKYSTTFYTDFFGNEYVFTLLFVSKQLKAFTLSLLGKKNHLREYFYCIPIISDIYIKSMGDMWLELNHNTFLFLI